MNLFRKLARESLWLLVARIGAQGCAVVVTYLLARRLSVDEFGGYSLFAALILIGNTLTTFGSDMVLIREIAARHDLSRLSSALNLQLILSILFIGFVYSFSPFLPSQTPEGISALRIYSLALIPLAFFTIFTSILRGKQKMGLYGWLNFIIPFLQVVVVLMFIRQGEGLVKLAVVLLGVQIIGTLLAGILCLPVSPDSFWGWRFSLHELRSLFVICVPVASIAIFGILYQRSTLFMLSILGTDSMTGLFSAAARIVEAARLGHIAAFTVFYPALAKEHHAGIDRRIFHLSGLFLVVAASGGSVLLFFLARPLIEVFFGSDYRASVPVLQVLAFSLIPYTVSSFLSLEFLAQNKEKILLRLLAFSLLVQLILSSLFIPRLGASGAGWAILIAETVQAVLFLSVLRIKSSRKMDILHPQGVLHELSDPSQ